MCWVCICTLLYSWECSCVCIYTAEVGVCVNSRSCSLSLCSSGCCLQWTERAGMLTLVINTHTYACTHARTHTHRNFLHSDILVGCICGIPQSSKNFLFPVHCTPWCNTHTHTNCVCHALSYTHTLWP